MYRGDPPTLAILGEPLLLQRIDGHHITVHTRMRLCPHSRQSVRVGNTSTIRVDVTSASVWAVTSSEVTYRIRLRTDGPADFGACTSDAERALPSGTSPRAELGGAR